MSEAKALFFCVSEKRSLRYVVGPRSIQMNTVMRSVLSARHEKRA